MDYFTLSQLKRIHYAEPHRKYHTLEHIDRMLQSRISFFPDLSKESAATIDLAIWFHDAYYDPRSTSNEEKSADLADSYCRSWDIPSDEVVRLILLTASHKIEPGDELGAIISDLDLEILGAPENMYRTYTQQIREEYSHLTDVEWVAGRSKFLLGVLGHPIYHTKPFQEIEAEAIRNIKLELKEIENEHRH